jgi:biopolymer transport protein ExbB/TolQ
MNSLNIVALIFAMSGLGVAVLAYLRLNSLEQKLKDLHVVPEDFSSQEFKR